MWDDLRFFVANNLYDKIEHFMDKDASKEVLDVLKGEIMSGPDSRKFSMLKPRVAALERAMHDLETVRIGG